MRRRFTVPGFALVSGLLWLSMLSSLAAGSPPSRQDDVLRDATLVFRRAVGTPSAAIPASIMMRAWGVAIVPGARKDGEVHYGTGILSARGATRDYWTPPAAVVFRGIIPVNLETDAIDFVFVAITRRGLDYLSRTGAPPPTAGGVYPGPLGYDARVDTDADILAYMQFGDYFAGVTVNEWSITPMKDGKLDRTLVGAWRDALASYFREMS